MNQILIHFGAIGDKKGEVKDVMFTLTLDEGRPAVHISGESKLVASDINMTLATNVWQHLAVSMPRKSCRLSEVRMFVNGKRVDTFIKGPDPRLFFVTAGSVSVGGFGFSHSEMETLLRNHTPYTGLIDEVYVWGRDVGKAGIQKLIY